MRMLLIKIEYPLFSVARNPLKKNEDYLVGADIVFGTDYILHQKNLLMQYMQVVCIGYGKNRLRHLYQIKRTWY